MILLPLSTFIFSLLAGSMDMGQPSSDVKRDIVSRYKDKGLQIEEPQEQEAEERREVDEEVS